MNITSIATQGKPYTSEYVQEFRIEFGYDGQDFAPYRDKFGNFKVGSSFFPLSLAHFF